MRLLLSLLLMCLIGVAQAASDPFAQPDFLPVNKAFTFSAEPLPSGETRLQWKIADTYYLYQKRFKFDGLDAAHAPVLPQGLEHSDEFFGATQVYRDKVEILIPADASGQVKMPNVNSLIETMDMREAQRSYEANLNVISSTRRMIQRTIDILRA